MEPCVSRSQTDLLYLQICAFNLPRPVAEHRFCDRRWRFDLAWPDQMLAVEVDGGGFIPGGGRHSRGTGMEKDNEKIATAMLMGWRVLRVTPRQVTKGEAIAWIQGLLVA